MAEITQYMDQASPECIAWFQGTVVDEFDSMLPDVVENMQDYFLVANNSAFTSQKRGSNPDAIKVAITPDGPITLAEAKERIQKLAAKRGLRVGNTVYASGRAYYMESR